MNERKLERQKRVQLAAVERAHKRALSLSVALLRADTLLGDFRYALKEIEADRRSHSEILNENLALVKEMRISPYLRMESLLTLHNAALYAVVEKWQQWRFADATVDRLLKDPLLKLLKEHRHSVFHAGEFDEKPLSSLGQHERVRDWIIELSNAFRDYFRRWHAAPDTMVLEHLQRVGW